MPTEKWSRLESTNRMTMAPSCCSPKASTISGMPRLPVLAKHGGQDQRGPPLSPEFEQGEQQAGQQDHQGTGPHKGQVGREIQGVFHQAEKTSAGVKSLILARLT